MNSTRRYLVAHLPVFRLERCGWLPDQIVVLADEERSALRVQAASPAARAAGIRCGMTVTEARAICPETQIERRDAAGEEADLAELTQQLHRISPSVAPLPPHAIVAEISRTAMLLARRGEGPPPQMAGAERVVIERVRRRLSFLGHIARVVVADAPATALACAAWGEADRVIPPGGGAEALAPLPLAALGLPTTAHDLLSGLGIDTVGAFAALPPASVVGRFPPLISLAHQLARGTAQPPVLRSEPEDATIVIEQDLGHAVFVLDALLFIINALLRDATARLAATSRAAVHVGLSLGLEGGRWQHLSIRLGAPTRDANRILSLVRARMERVELAGPAESVCLEIIEPVPFDGRQVDLVDRQRSDEQVADVTARLQDTLGAEQVGFPRLVDNLRPEEAWRCESVAAAYLGMSPHARSTPTALRAAVPPQRRLAAVGMPLAPHSAIDPRSPDMQAAITSDPAAEWAGHPDPSQPLRPALLLPQPVAIEVRTGRWGRPTRLHHDGRWLSVTDVDGPERRKGAWWSARPYNREYWRVRISDGRRAWIYREDDHWALHGWWDADST